MANRVGLFGERFLLATIVEGTLDLSDSRLSGTELARLKRLDRARRSQPRDALLV